MDLNFRGAKNEKVPWEINYRKINALKEMKGKLSGIKGCYTQL